MGFIKPMRAMKHENKASMNALFHENKTSMDALFLERLYLLFPPYLKNPAISICS